MSASAQHLHQALGAIFTDALDRKDERMVALIDAAFDRETLGVLGKLVESAAVNAVLAQALRTIADADWTEGCPAIAQDGLLSVRGAVANTAKQLESLLVDEGSPGLVDALRALDREHPGWRAWV